MPLTRQELIEKITWNNGGYGFGICAVGNALLWALDRPGPDNPDLKSIVAVTGPLDKYTDEELARLAEFSEKKTAEYDKMFKWRRGANLILFDKDVKTGQWLRKRITWTMGPMWSTTLEEAIAVMER